MFSNEAGLDSSVMVHSSSNVKEPSGAIDLTTGVADEAILETIGGSSNLMSYSFGQVFGGVGQGFIAIAILLFAYSTVLGWSHYGATACRYLFGDKAVLPYQIVFVVIVLAGSVMTAQLAWDISDTFNGLMMIPNLIGVLVLSPQVAKATRNYIARHFHGSKEEPVLSVFPEIQKMQAEAIANAESEEDAE